MHPRSRIHSFLRAVRRGLRRREAARAALWGTAALVLLALLAPLAAMATAAEQGQSVGALSLAAAGAVALATLAAGVVRPLRRWRGDRAVARHVGRLAPPIASDLLSAVELTDPARPPRGHVSGELVDALVAHTARRVDGMSPAQLAAHRRLGRAAAALAGVSAAYVAVAALLPGTVSAGWQRMVRPPAPAPFDGAHLSPVPLVGDLRIALAFPAYTGRATVELPSSSGDFRALPGTEVTLEADALVPVTSAAVIVDWEPGAGSGPEASSRTASHSGGEWRGAGATRGEDPQHVEAEAPAGGAGPADSERSAATKAEKERAQIPVEVDGQRLRARLTVRGAGTYRFLIEGPGGQRRVEAAPRRIEIEPDRAPTVELFAPADELDVTRLKRVEIAYVGEDDYGIAAIELVWDNAGETGRKPLPLTRPGAQSAQGRVFWDLAEVSLRPGARVPYHLEITDNDSVSGPNVGRSRTFYLRVFSPREKHEQLVGRQKALFENMLRALGGRLVVEPDDLRAHVAMQREAADLVVELGTLLAALRDDELADDGLRAALEAMRAAIDKLVEAEAKILARLRPPAIGADPAGGAPLSGAAAGPADAAWLTRLAASNRAVVAELEEDVILLANWLDRQQMENLLAISDEMKRHQDRLEQLFKEYQRTGSAELLAEIQRELRALEQLQAELAGKRTGLAEDVLDRFVNSDAMAAEREDDCLARVRALVEAGDVGGAQAALGRCTGAMDGAAEAMERALRELRGDTFGGEEKKFTELMDELGDLALDQGEVARQAESIFERYAERADELIREEARETKKQVEATLSRLRRRLDRVPEDGLTPFSKEELEIARERLADVEAMLDDGDIAEALAMARQAKVGVETMAEELSSAVEDEGGGGEPWASRTEEAAREVGRALPLARQLVEELEARAPSPEDIMRPADRKALEKLRRQQRVLRGRARRLAQKAERLGGELPGGAGPAIAQGVGRSEGHMDRAEGRMQARDPGGARQEARDAAEALEQALEDARGAARNRQATGRVGLRDEEVRIPGADEYKPPEEFREDILEAMKREQAPAGFGEMVKRYYEELIR